MVELRHARHEDWELLKEIRLRALRDSPDAFCVTHDEAAGYDDEVWIERSSAEPGEGSSASFLAIDRDEVVGMSAGILCDQHRMDVVSLFVTPSHRGTGLAQELMKMVEAWGRTRGAYEAVLDVEADNQRAGSFYTSLGYLPTGRRETYPGRVWLHRVELARPLGES
jgi:ribosomal protein S18 acetylase RimI-like enzyme